MGGLPVDIVLVLVLALLPPAWEDYARAREGEAADPAAAVSTYRTLKASDPDVASLAFLRLMELEPRMAADHFRSMARRGPTQEVLEAGLDLLIDSRDPQAAALFSEFGGRAGAPFRRTAEKHLVEPRFLAGPGERKRLVREVMEGKSAFKKARLGRLCLDYGYPLPSLQWEEIFKACLEARELGLAEAVLDKIKPPLQPAMAYSVARLRFLQGEYSAALSLFDAAPKDDDAARYQAARCHLALGDLAGARAAFGRVAGRLAPLAKLGVVRAFLTEGNLGEAMIAARSISPGRSRRDAILACSIGYSFAADGAQALRLLKELKPDDETAYWRARFEGSFQPGLSPKSAPFNALHLEPVPLPPGPDPMAPVPGDPPSTFPQFLLAHGLWEDAWLFSRRLALDDRERAALADRVGEYRKEMNLAYPEASRMLAGPIEEWQPSVLSHFFPRAYEAQVLKAAALYDVPAEVIWSVMRQESTYNPDALSPAGAMGLMQLIPPTYGEYANGIGTVWQAEENILSGAKYLAKLHAQFGNWVCAVAAYNAGEDAVAAWVRIPAAMDLPAFYSLIPYSETKAYVRSVLYNMMLYRMLYPDLRPALVSRKSN